MTKFLQIKIGNTNIQFEEVNEVAWQKHLSCMVMSFKRVSGYKALSDRVHDFHLALFGPDRSLSYLSLALFIIPECVCCLMTLPLSWKSFSYKLFKWNVFWIWPHFSALNISIILSWTASKNYLSETGFSIEVPDLFVSSRWCTIEKKCLHCKETPKQSSLHSL